MISFREAAAGLYGAWRLARLDPSGLAYFDASERGFWRSFWAAAINAPGYAVVVAYDYAHNPPVASDLRILAVHTIAYVISWTAFPLAMAWVTNLLGRDAHYMRYIVAQNWANVLEMLLFMIVLAVSMLVGETAGALPLVATVLVMAYQWYVARIVLVIAPLAAVGVVALDLFVDLTVLSVVQVLAPAATP